MSELISNFHFIRPLVLLTIPVALGVWWFWQRAIDPLRGWREQIEPELLEALTVGNSVARRSPARWLLTGWLTAALAAAGPTWRMEPSPFADDGTPLMIVLKADSSMLQPDPAPSRMDRAHLKITDLAEARAGKPLGLIAYAGSAHLVLPPTRDTEIISTMAKEIGPAIMPLGGDRLDLAFLEAGRILSEGDRGGSILVVTDSVDTDRALLASTRDSVSFPIQFLAINAPISSQNDSIQQAAATLNATVHRIDIEGSDVAAIVRRAAKTSVAQSGGQDGRWQEAGSWLVPFIGLLVLCSFRRENSMGKST